MKGGQRHGIGVEVRNCDSAMEEVKVYYGGGGGEWQAMFTELPSKNLKGLIALSRDIFRALTRNARFIPSGT